MSTPSFPGLSAMKVAGPTPAPVGLLLFSVSLLLRSPPDSRFTLRPLQELNLRQGAATLFRETAGQQEPWDRVQMLADASAMLRMTVEVGDC